VTFEQQIFKQMRQRVNHDAIDYIIQRM